MKTRYQMIFIPFSYLSTKRKLGTPLYWCFHVPNPLPCSVNPFLISQVTLGSTVLVLFPIPYHFLCNVAVAK